jgi:acetylornithine deacetylase/succinyl-diaminopimelate desuccinylase-like protein
LTLDHGYERSFSSESSRLVDDILELARIPAPTFSEEARLDWIRQRVSGGPGSLRRDDAGNLVWRWGDGRPRLLVTAHVDTVFGDGTELEIRREGSVLTGPGVGDNAAAVAVAIHAVEALLARRELAPGAVAFTVCEEGLGNLRGANAVCESLEPALFIALEGHGLDEVLVDAIGSVRMRVSVSGPGGHPWVDHERPSSVHALLELGSELARRPPEGARVNIGVISGGTTVNSIADNAYLLLEGRAGEESALDATIVHAQSLRLEPPLEIHVDVLGRRPAGRLDRDAALLRTVREVRAELGLPDVLGAGSTDANAALARGIPALTLGVAEGSGMHSTRERIDLDSLALGLRQVERVVERVLSPHS